MDAGELIAGRYRLVSLLGRGGMSVVWSARDERGDRMVAVKQLATDAPAREARIAGRLRHPNAVAVLDVVLHNGKSCLVMEYLDARSLGAAGVLAPREVAQIGSQVAAALTEAHAAGIVHRDIKPDNILIAADGTAKITDFGISRAIGEGTLTAAAMIAGTPAYLAPEVADGEPADYRSDVFALGATLYAALEGEPPFGFDDNPISLLRRVATGEFRPPQRSGELTGLLLLLLRRNPAERPTMREAHEALAALATGQPQPSFKPRTPTMVLPASRALSRRAVLGAVGAACLVAAGVAIGVIIGDGGGSGQASPPSAATSAPRSSTPAEPPCAATYRITGTWPDHYQVDVSVHNTGGTSLSGWKVSWTVPSGHRIESMWNGARSGDDGPVTVTNADYNATIRANASTSFGFIARSTNTDPTVPDITCASD